MECQRVHFEYIEGEVLQSARKLVDYLKEDEKGDFIFCTTDEEESNHIFHDIQRIDAWLEEMPGLSRKCWRLTIGFYLSLFLLLISHWAWHLGFFDNIFFR